MEPVIAATNSFNKEVLYGFIGLLVVTNLGTIITILIMAGKIIWKIATMDMKIKAAHQRLDELKGIKTKYHENGEEK